MNERRRQFCRWLSGFIALLLLGGCASEKPGGPVQVTVSSAASGPGVAQPLRADEPRGAAGTSAAAQAALDSLGSELLATLPAADNAVLSPYSIYAVLAMARAGAKGVTGSQLDAVLGGDGTVQQGNVAAIDKAVAAALAAGRPPAGADPANTDTRPVAVDVADSVWLSPALPVRRTYLDALAIGFGAGMFQIDYAGSPEAARKTINGWVGDHTNHVIPQLLGPGTITQDTVMTLVNAMYLSAPWQNDFYRTSTPMPFSTASGKQVTAPAMSATAMLASAAGTGWTSVTIPYRGSGLAMTVVLPDANSFGTVRAELPKILPLAAAAKPLDPISLTMPLFKTEVHLSLVPAMAALGVEQPVHPLRGTVRHRGEAGGRHGRRARPPGGHHGRREGHRGGRGDCDDGSGHQRSRRPQADRGEPIVLLLHPRLDHRGPVVPGQVTDPTT